jgi:hypothetical protein
MRIRCIAGHRVNHSAKAPIGPLRGLFGWVGRFPIFLDIKLNISDVPYLRPFTLNLALRQNAHLQSDGKTHQILLRYANSKHVEIHTFYLLI